MANPNAAKSGTFKLGGDIEINRLGFGAMRVTGSGVWGEPADRAEAMRTLKRLPALHVNFIDTADSRAGRLRRADPRGAASLSRPAHRDQGRADANRPRAVDPGRSARVSDPAGAFEPPPARCRADRPLAAAPHRPEGAARRAVRRRQDASRKWRMTPIFEKRLDGAELLVARHLRVDAVQLPKADLLDTEPAAAEMRLLDQISGRPNGITDPGPVRVAALGRNEDACEGMQRLADQLLGDAGPVGIGGVDKFTLSAGSRFSVRIASARSSGSPQTPCPSPASRQSRGG